MTLGDQVEQSLEFFFDNYQCQPEQIFMGKEAANALGIDTSDQPPNTVICLSKTGVTYVEVPDDEDG